MQLLGVKPQHQLAHHSQPYKAAVDCLNRIASYLSPVDKLNCVLEAVNLTRTAVLEYWKGRVELLAMDDQLPVTIYVATQVTEPTFVAQLALLQDFAVDAAGLENEFFLLVTLESAVAFVINDLVA